MLLGDEDFRWDQEHRKNKQQSNQKSKDMLCFFQIVFTNQTKLFLDNNTVPLEEGANHFSLKNNNNNTNNNS